MANAEATAPPNGSTPKRAFSDDQIALIRRTICKPKKREATDDEVALFIYQCERTGLDPFSRQIYAIFRWSKQAGTEIMTVQCSIDGFRLVAERTGKYIGQDGPFWCGSSGIWSDIWTSKDAPTAARVVVKKLLAGVVGETPAVAHFTEYVPLRNNQPTGQWASMPALMIGKCAEALALRKAFPAETSGIYTAEEMAQAEEASGAVSEVRAGAAPAAQPSPVATALDEEKVNHILGGIRALGSFSKLQTILGACGIDAVAENSTESITGRVQGLSEENADKLAAELGKAVAAAEQDAHAEKPDQNGGED